MAEKTRMLKFYLLSMRTKSDDKELSWKEIEKRFQSIVKDKMKDVGEKGHKAMNIELNDGSYVIELVKQKEHVSYIKLGIGNPSNSVSLRNKDTLETSDVHIGPNQRIEIYTFCIIDFENRILSYVGMNGSPRVTALKEMINKIYSEDGYAASLSLICSPDVIKALVKKKRVTSLKVELAVPNDKQLSDIGVAEPTFDGLRGRYSRTVSFCIKAERGKSLFDDSNKGCKIIKTVLGKLNEDSIEKIIATGKDEGDSSAKTFNLLDYGATIYEQINRSEYDSGDDDKRMAIIYSAYSKKRNDIISFIKK